MALLSLLLTFKTYCGKIAKLLFYSFNQNLSRLKSNFIEQGVNIFCITFLGVLKWIKSTNSHMNIVLVISMKFCENIFAAAF